MVRPSGEKSLQLKHVLQPLLVSLNSRSELESSKSNFERCFSHSDDRVLRNLASTDALSQLHLQSIFSPDRTDRFVHRLSFRRKPALQLFLELRRWIDWNGIVSSSHLLLYGNTHRGPHS